MKSRSLAFVWAEEADFECKAVDECEFFPHDLACRLLFVLRHLEVAVLEAEHVAVFGKQSTQALTNLKVT